MIIGDRDALGWVVTEQRMAFPVGRSQQAQAVGEGDEVLLYTTRGCFRNPNRDRGRLMGRATVSSPVQPLPQPLHLSKRTFSAGCSLEIHSLAEWRGGLMLSDLVPQLQIFPDPTVWSVRMRRATLTLPPADALLLRTAVAPLLHPYRDMVDAYRHV
ncbi:hypothetical protein GCM10017562_34570 [Streptomyces roseofulvus]